MQANIIEYELLDRIAGEEGFIWQYDLGQKLKFKNIELPFSYEVHFANSSSGPSWKVLGDSSGVVIPYDVTKTGKPVYLWLYIVTDVNSAQTVYGNTIRVRMRAEVATETPTPEQQSVIEQTISALNAAVEEVHGIAEGIPDAIEAALAEAKASGEFKGDPGAVFTPAINDGVMTWSNNGNLPNPDPVDFREVFDLNDYATKQELNGKVDSGLIGSANGVAGLDASGRVPSEQLPSYVDDVLEFPAVNMFPNPGETGKIYISLSNNHQYRWTGTQYIDITSGDMETRKADKRDTVLETTLSRGRKSGTNVGTGSIAFGYDVEASGDYSKATGNGSRSPGHYSSAEGSFSEATNSDAHAEGYASKATGPESHAEGKYSLASSTAAHAEGIGTESSGTGAHAEGNYTKATASYSHAEGNNTKATRQYAHAEGTLTESNAECAHAEGANTRANGGNSHAEGQGGTFTVDNTNYTSGANGTASHSEGYHTYTLGTGSHAEGYNTVASNDGAHSEGHGTKASDDGAHAEGQNTIASNDASHAEGQGTAASGTGSHAEGGNTTASGSFAHAEGIGATASGDVSHAEGTSTATGTLSHAEGSGTLSSGEYGSHSEGGGTQATGSYAHAEGGGSRATGTSSHAEGSGTLASAQSAHSEGSGTQATGDYAHAEGGGSHAIGNYSHAEGSGTYSPGYCAHVEGGGSTASGEFAHAQNQATIASGRGSTSEGYGTVASGSYSSVGGLFNIADSYENWTEWTQGEHCVPGDKRKRTRLVDEQTVVEGFICKTENTDSDWTASHWNAQSGKMNYAEIIGNGTADDASSNARATDWDGNGFYKGSLYVGCNADSSGGSKVVCDDDFATDEDTQAIITEYWGVS